VENDFWDQVYQGVTHFEAARAVGVGANTGRRWLQATGGVRPRLVLMFTVDPRNRPRCLTELERSHIELRWEAGAGVRRIAREIARDPATVSREIARNGFTRSGYHRDGSARGRRRYRADLAQLKAEQRRRRPKTRRLVDCPRLADRVQTRLGQRWSPRQIAVTLRREHPEDPEMWVSHETIYQSLYVQGRGGLRAELHRQLRIGRALRKPRAATRRQAGRSSIPEPVSISQRPAEVADRAVPGHWEGDLIIGKTTAPRWARWSNAQPVTACCCTCPTDTAPSRSATPWSPRSAHCPGTCGGH